MLCRKGSPVHKFIWERQKEQMKVRCGGGSSSSKAPKKNRALACCRRYFQSHVFMIIVSRLANHRSGARPRWSLPSSSGIPFSMSMILRRIQPCFHGSDFFRTLQACCPENVKKPCSVPWASLGEGVAWSQMVCVGVQTQEIYLKA